MKKIWIYLLLLMSATSSAQITLDTIVTPWNGFGFDFYTVQISQTETKYLFEDSVNNSFNLYNMDFTPFMTNIYVPEPFAPTTAGFQVIYVSRSLFDCDSTNIEYAFEASHGGIRPFYIMRTDGTQLFKLDSANGPYCFGCLDGSDVIRPIRNTSSGAKLFLHHPPYSQSIYIYSLCGKLIEDAIDFTSMPNQYYVTIFPNPSSTIVNFKISLPDNKNDYEFVIVDQLAKEVNRIKINSINCNYSLDMSNYNNGSYYYSLCSKNKSYQSGKFILTK